MQDRAQEIFEQTVDLSTTARDQAIRAACGDDAKLRKEVEALLGANDGAGDFMANPTVDHIAAYSKPAEQAGTTIGRYKLLEQIGQGGFGDVYMAQQLEPVKRRVALKIIKLGMDTKQVVARFEAERQALALMDHPNIAKVLDGGETESGRPYFVMELVRGDPITEYCDREKLSMRHRLTLFQQVCQAIQHAHQKGVIHRDIKPNNVLVTVADGQPLVKVIDFGIAKATNTELTEKTLFTEFRQLIGTPQYMSPEQAERSGVDIDTRSDVYSLGVLLYEMLTGRTPVDPKALKTAVWEELQRMIREDEPTRPSMLVTSLANDSEAFAKIRGMEPARLGSALKGDLDWIVLKALEKDRTRRYGAASELSDDVQRYLDDQDVTATPPSTSYKLRKAFRRNKTAIAIGTAFATLLVFGLIASTFNWMLANQARDEAVKSEQVARKAEESAKVASARADQQADRARRMAAMVANPFTDNKAAPELAKAWLADIEHLKKTKELSDKEICIQQCQLATWWHYHKGGEDSTKLIEELYEPAKKLLGTGDANFLSLVNTNIVAHVSKYSDQQIAGLYGDLVECLRIQKAGEYESLLPQYAAALLKAGRDQDATDVLNKFLAIRKGPQPVATNPAVEKYRLNSSWDTLAAWGEDHPEQLAELKKLRKGISLVEIPIDERSIQKWEGTLDVGVSKLKLRFEIGMKHDRSEFVGKVISVDENNTEISLTDMSFEDGVVTMEFGGINATFKGKANADNSECSGLWTQNGTEIDFTIKRIENDDA